MTLTKWTDDNIYLLNKKGDTLELDIKYTTSFKPRYAMTVHKSQGSTFTENYSIYESDKMSSRMLYVALTRAREMNQINFCNIDIYNAYKGYIYSYELNGKHYIGSTRDINKRKQEHKSGTKAGNTKFKNAIAVHGYDNFNFKVLETLEFNNIKDLWELEDKYISKYDSINNGYNIRRNIDKK
jgi:predicted GIY-YIG superfamily endonuclease